MDPALLTALSGAVLGVIGVVISALTARSAATKDEINSLRQTIIGLSQENERLRRRVQDLENENLVKDRRIDELGILVDQLKSENHSLKGVK